jgi:hypothetical protein
VREIDLLQCQKRPMREGGRTHVREIVNVISTD